MSRKKRPPEISWLDTRIEALPSWARPSFYGMLFVWMLTLARGGIVLPIIILAALFQGGPHAVLEIVWLFIALSLAGFAGGTAFSLARPVLRPLGRWHVIPLGWCCVLAYACVILPLIASVALEHRRSFAFDTAGWIAIAIASLLFGSLLGAFFLEPAPGRKRPAWVQRAQRVTSRVPPTAG
jgi:hypothetical protein